MAVETATADQLFEPQPRGVDVSVVAPAFNEAAVIDDLVSEIVSQLRAEEWTFEVVLVDDGSDDGTAECIRELCAGYRPVRGVLLRSNFGQSAALAAGFDHAVGETIVGMDADGQNDPADIPALVDRLEEGVGAVSGWRQDRDDPLSKRIPSAIQTRLAKLTGPDINDFGCTLTAYDADALDEVTLRGEGHRYIPAQIHKAGFEVDEMVVNHRPRTAGDSKYGAGRLLRGFVDLLYQVFWVRYSDRPMHVFGGTGAVLFGIGVLLGTTLLAQNYLFGIDLLPNLPQLILAVGLTLFGFGVFSLGIIGELLTQLVYRNESPYRVGELVE